MRPLLLPALRGLWRDPATWQIGLEPSRAVQVAGADRTTVTLVAGLDGTRDLAEVCTAAADHMVDPRAFGTLIGRLERAGVVVDATGRTLPSDRHTDRRRRLDGDATTLSLRHADPERVLRERAAASVVVSGRTRLTVPLATHLAAAGVGRVHVQTDGDVTAGELQPGGPGAADEYRLRAEAARDAIRRAAPEVATGPLPEHLNPDLVVLTDGLATAPSLIERLVARGVAHLMLSVREDRGLVGPLVLPGSTACLRCADLHRTDRDRAWPLLLAQLAGDPGSTSCDVALAATVVALGAGQSLAHLDGEHCDALEGVLEVVPPGFRVRRRSYLPHPRCGCLGVAPAATG